MTADPPEQPDVWAPGPTSPVPRPAPPAPGRPALLAASLVGAAPAVYFAVVSTAGAWALGHDDSDTGQLAGIVLLPVLIVLAVVAGALAVGLLVVAGVQTRRLRGQGHGRLMLLWLVPLAAAAAWPVRALLP